MSNLFLIFFPFPVVVCIVVSFFVLLRIRRAKIGLPVVPGGLPFFGQVFVMVKGSPWDRMTEWTIKNGKNYVFHLFGSDPICIADPKSLKVILSTKMSVFRKDLEWTYKPFMVLLGSGLVTADGQNWRRQRTLLSHTLRVKVLEDIPVMAYQAVSRLCIKLQIAKNRNEIVEMAEQFRHLTLQVIAEAILSLDSKESDQTFARMYLPIVTEGNLRTWSPQRMYLPSPSWFQFQHDVRRLNNYVTDIITQRWKLRLEEKRSELPSNRKQDILDISLDAIPENEWGSTTIHQIRDEVKTFILAGHETSASTLTWTLFELCRNPEYMSRAREEAEKVFGVTSLSEGAMDFVLQHPPSVEKLAELRFIYCCLKESLRKYSVVPSVVRTAAEDVDIEQMHIPKGATVMLNLQGVHHNPHIWPEPLVYNPDRFLKDPEPYTFLAFIDGPRQCLGQNLSLLETKIVIALLLLSFDFQVMNPDAHEKHPFMVPIIPKNGHFMKIL
mmetsp:Transcript_13/g.6  ORF Transcript_13/g.6 Transcript_13/m.6 type:complete len:497 (+) Transcript_13:136-1626(+)